MNHFYQSIYQLVSSIPPGKVVSYGQIANVLGNPRSSRLIGWAMHSCPRGVPWQRVVKKTGQLPFCYGSMEYITQRELLEMEGVVFLPDGTIDMNQFEWTIPFPD